ncbi:MAG: AGE family epimerase/isomerase [Pseudomonadota bacterium]
MRDFYLSKCLPLWIDRALDRQKWCFHEALNSDGAEIEDGRTRTRSAARCIYVYADASHRDLAPSGALDVAEECAHSLTKTTRTDEGLFARVFNRETGEILDSAADLYDQSCVLLAFAALARATKDQTWLLACDEILSAHAQHLKRASGGFAEDTLGSLPRRQNPHMHLFEALTLLCETNPTKEYTNALTELFHLFQTRFVDSDGVVREYFDAGWNTGPDINSHIVEAGHMAEWAWLLNQAQPFLSTDCTPVITQLYNHARRLGCDENNQDFLVNSTDLQSGVKSDTRRLWPQAEYIKAALAAGDFYQAGETCNALLKTYLNHSEAGLWNDEYDCADTIISTTAPASSLYHLWTAVDAIEKTFAANTIT